MRTQQDAIAEILRSAGGLIRRRGHPELARAIDNLTLANRLRRLLPGVYCVPSMAEEFETKVAATALWSPDAVILRQAAARLTFWPDLNADPITVAAPSRRPATPPGWLITRRRIDPDSVLECNHSGFLTRVTSPAFTAVDLIDGYGGTAIDEALRSRQATIDGIWDAFSRCRNRRGNQARLQILIESRAEPWSEAERRLHQLLHQAGITGWRANAEVRIGGRTYFPDVGFLDLRLSIEVDGKAHLFDPVTFQKDGSGRTRSRSRGGPCCGSPGRTSPRDPRS